MKLLGAVSCLTLISIGIFAQANFTDITNGNSIYSTNRAVGVAVIDYDNDGDDDIFVSANPCKLFRNDGAFVFEDVTSIAGIIESAKVSVWFDANNDGWLDVVTSSWTKTSVYINNHDGTFKRGNELGIQPRQSLLVGDMNGDQWPDLYSANFRQPNQVLFNTGKGNFGVNKTKTGAELFNAAMGGVLLDFDQDGDLDIYLVFDANEPNALLLNDGKGTFIESAAAYGLNTKSNGMGVDFADFNHDGVYDFYISNLFKNFHLIGDNNLNYQNIAEGASTNDNGMGWGTFTFDYNNDTYSDIYCANAYGFNNYPNVLYRNNGDESYTNVATGTALEIISSCNGSAYGDFDLDGREDIVVAIDGDNRLRILQNAESSAGNWIQLNLVGKKSNKFAIGSRIELDVNGTILMDEITAGSGYASQNSYTSHFGLGEATVISSLSVHWPDGTVESFQNLGANHRYLVVEDEPLREFDASQYLGALSAQSQLSVPVDTFTNVGSIVIDEHFSTARVWNEALLEAIRHDFARPTIHARNLFHTSIAMYDAWAAYESKATTYLLGKTIGNYTCSFNGVAVPENKIEAQRTAISFAAFRLLIHRFQNSPNAIATIGELRKIFSVLGYDENFTSTDYSNGNPAALGNYIAEQIIEYGLQDGSNEANGYANSYYQPVNPPFNPANPGDVTIVDPNHWQPISLTVSIDQNGNPVQNTPPFLSPEWGNVIPFAMSDNDVVSFTRNGHEYKVYHDPGQFPLIDPINGAGRSPEYMWNFSLVSIWSSHLDPSDGVMIDVSPASVGNIPESVYPSTFEEFKNFYDIENGGDPGKGYDINPRTNLPYTPQFVPRGDYARVLAEFWADGPNSETPPGHWFTILNYVDDHPLFERKFNGVGEKMNALEWDVKAYFTLGGALHDAAISAWGIKGYYDGVRPVSAIRSMAGRGQCSDPGLPNYSPSGIPLRSGLIELVTEGDLLAGNQNENVGKVKLYAWRGPDLIHDPKVDDAGVGWILAENWWPYQRPTFVSPPFAGYISGHSTYSRAGAYVLSWLTGDEYFPGGMSEFHAPRNEYLVFEDGPSVDVVLQWAKYKDASDQCSLSRIWGGIHPPFDDMPGRKIGKIIGADACELAAKYFDGSIVTSTGEIQEVFTDVYPNPIRVGQSIQLKSSLFQTDSKVQLFDEIGRPVKQISYPGGEDEYFSFSTTQIHPGAYTLVLSNGHHRVTRRLLVLP